MLVSTCCSRLIPFSRALIDSRARVRVTTPSSEKLVFSICRRPPQSWRHQDIVDDAPATIGPRVADGIQILPLLVAQIGLEGLVYQPQESHSWGYGTLVGSYWPETRSLSGWPPPAVSRPGQVLHSVWSGQFAGPFGNPLFKRFIVLLQQLIGLLQVFFITEPVSNVEWSGSRRSPHTAVKGADRG